MQFLDIAKRAILRHGMDLIYATVVTGAYNTATGKPSTVRTEYTKRMYPKQFLANQYNYPTLVGKETVMFYLANDSLGFIPKVNDEIEYKSKTYKVQSVQEHFAEGAIALYKMIGVRG